jgi:chromosome segregation ATPase
MESLALKQLEKKLEYTVDLISKLKDQTQVKEIHTTTKERELQEFRAKEEQLRQEIALMEKEGKHSKMELQKRQKELRKKIEGVVTKLTLLEKSV